MKKNVKTKAAILLASLASGAAFAESPAAGAMESISTEASALIAAGWPILVTVVVAGVGMKLFKKMASKST